MTDTVTGPTKLYMFAACRRGTSCVALDWAAEEGCDPGLDDAESFFRDRSGRLSPRRSRRRESRVHFGSLLRRRLRLPRPLSRRGRPFGGAATE